MLIAVDNLSQINSSKLEFSNRFNMKNLGTATKFLCIKIYRDSFSQTLYVSLTDCARNVLEIFDM